MISARDIAHKGIKQAVGVDLREFENTGIINDLPAWAIALLVTVFGVWMFSILVIDYTIKDVMTTMLHIEDPASVGQTHESAKIERSSDDEKKMLIDPELDATKGLPLRLDEPQPVRKTLITSSIRRTIRHLISQGGRRALFRGFAARMVYSCSFSFVAQALARLGLPIWMNMPLASLIVSPLDTVWKTVIMTKPSSKYWYQRLPSMQASRKILPAAALMAITHTTSNMSLWLNAAALEGEIDMDDESQSPRGLLLQMALPIILKLVLVVLIEIPSNVTLTRTQLSVLAEEEETIVPADRTFGGKVVPQSEGGSGVVGLLDAWRTFGWNSRIRLLVLYAKMWAIQTVSMVITFAVSFCVASWAESIKA